MNEFYEHFKQVVSDDNIEDDVDNVIDLDGFNNEPSPMVNDQITKKDVENLGLFIIILRSINEK